MSTLDDDTRQTGSDSLLDPQEFARYAQMAEERCGLVVRGDGAMMRVLEELILQGRSDAIVTLIGEPGVGKEGFARFIHHSSPREADPFVAVNMAGISEHLFESELFGHARGSFTSANGDRTGRFEEAGRGTLFLDEIGDMPYGNQGLLLRALSRQRTYSRVGENRVQSVRAKIVCATNADIHHMVRIGRMRQDLHDRLCECVVVLPPFRQRSPEHQQHVIEHLVRRVGGELSCDQLRLSSGAMQLLRGHPLDGNVRGVENVIRRAGNYAVALRQSCIEESHMRRALEETERSQEAPSRDVSEWVRLALEVGLHSVLEEMKQRVISQVVVAMAGNIGQAARVLRVDRKTLCNYLRGSDHS